MQCFLKKKKAYIKQYVVHTVCHCWESIPLSYNRTNSVILISPLKKKITLATKQTQYFQTQSAKIIEPKTMMSKNSSG